MLNRRRAALLIAGGLSACASVPPADALRSPGAQRVLLLEPRHHPEPALRAGFSQRFASAAFLAGEQAELANMLRGWERPVLPAFEAALASGLRERRVAVERIARGSPEERQLAGGATARVLHSHLEAGFVYRTLAADTYAPFVQALLMAQAPDGSVPYRKVYVATRRPFNPFLGRLEGASRYEAADLQAVARDPAAAVQAFTVLAAQLGAKFAAELASA
jgi:hypothetical protein